MSPDRPVAEYEFLPSVREGILPDAAYDGSERITDPGAVTVSLDAQASEDDGESWGATETVSVDLLTYGPSEVIGIDRRQVVRAEPEPDTGDFPPNYFPLVEFDRPDLPWVFSPERRNEDDGAKARPWCCLVTVERRDGVSLLGDAGGPLPVLEIADPAAPSEELPDLGEAWAWAHAQVVADPARLDEGTDYLDGVLTGQADRTRSRLISPRNLRKNRSYYACVVPVFEQGRLAGLGKEPFPGGEEGDGADGGNGADGDGADGDGGDDGGDGDGGDGGDAAVRELTLAWTVDDEPPAIRLPVYYHWEFSTGPRGDFEQLARRLEPRTLGPNVGYRDVDASDPGPDALVETDEGTVTTTGALHSAIEPDEVKPYPGDLSDELTTLLNRPEVIADDGVEAVGPPTYGRWHAGVDRLDGEPAWLARLNDTPRTRLPAGFGTQVVQDHQEELMRDAWDQFGDLGFGNQVFGAAQLADAVASAVHRGLADVPAEALLGLTVPMHAEVLWDGSITLRRRVLEVAPRAAARPAFRRVTRPRGPLGRRVDPDVATSLPGGFASGRLRVDPPDGVADRTVDLDRRLSAMGRAGVADRLSALGDVGGAGVAVDATWRYHGGGMLAAAAERTGEGPGSGVELAEEPPDADEVPAPGRPPDADPSGVEHRTFAYRSVDGVLPAEDGAGDHPVRVARAAVESVEEHVEEARRQLSELATAVAGARTGEGPDGEAIRRLLDEGPTVLDHCAAVRRNTFRALNRSVTRAITTTPEPSGLDLERKDSLYRRAETLHADAMDHLEAAAAALRSPPFEVDRVLRDLGAADRTLAELLYATDRIASALGAVDPGEWAVRATAGEAPEGLVADAGAPGEGGEATAAIVGEEGWLEDASPLLEAIRPGDHVVELIAERLALDPEWLRSRADPLAPVMAHPEFDQPTYEWLAERSQQYLLPGVDEIPRNTVGLLVTDREFVEAFLAGTNHEMARELLWRGFPTDRRGTYFEHFWDRRGVPAYGGDPPPDVDPIHRWTGGLGDNAPAESDDEEVVLLVKGELLRRYPNTTIYAAKAVQDGEDRVPAVPDTHVTRELASDEETDPKDYLRFPVFRGKLDPDVTFFGFPLEPGEAVEGTMDGQDPGNELEQGWFFVYEEQPDEPRFGLDAFDRSDVGTVPAGITAGATEPGTSRSTETMNPADEERGAEAGWDALAWGHLPEAAESVADVGTYVSVAESRPGREDWAVEEGERWIDPGASDVGAEEARWDDRDAATWGTNSAHTARITWQRPARVAVHADDMIPEDAVDDPGGS